MSSLRELDPRLAPTALAFVDALRSAGLVVTVTSVVRSRAKQRRLYDAYISGQSALPALPPGQSLHEHGLAWDMVISPPHYQSVVGHIWQSLGGQWGGTVKDPVHFQAKQLLGRS